jgi:hypothetical protein
MKRKLLIPALLGSFILLFAACKNCTKCTSNYDISYEICGNNVKACTGNICYDTTMTSVEIDALKTSLENSGFTCN